MNYIRHHVRVRETLGGKPVKPFCYSTVMKAASCSIFHAIADHVGIYIAPDTTPAGVNHWKQYGLGLHETENLGNDVFHFTFVRNSWDRVISYWAMMTTRRYPLDDWLDEMLRFSPDDPHVATQLRTLKVMPEFVGRIEHFERDWPVVQERTGLPSLGPRVNTSKREPNYRRYYSKKSRKMVAEFYAEEIERFNFQF